VERLKRRALTLDDCNSYFWRTYDNQQIDLVEQQGGRLIGYEMKWTKRKQRPPKAWADAYPDAGLDFLSTPKYGDLGHHFRRGWSVSCTARRNGMVHRGAPFLACRYQAQCVCTIGNGHGRRRA